MLIMGDCPFVCTGGTLKPGCEIPEAANDRKSFRGAYKPGEHRAVPNKPRGVSGTATAAVRPAVPEPNESVSAIGHPDSPVLTSRSLSTSTAPPW